MSIDEAAQAFQNDINGGSSKPEGKGSPVEQMFSNSQAHEPDLVAGGDDEPDPKPKRAKDPEPDRGNDDDEDEVISVFGLEGEGDEDEDDEKGEGDEDEDDEKGEGEEEDAGSGLPKSLLERKVTIMVDGEEEEVSLKEAIESGIRVKTFHKRLNQLDGVKQELLGFAGRIADDRKKATAMLEEAEQLIAGILPVEPDWDKLFAEDPKAARELQKTYQDYKTKITEIRGKREKISKEKEEQDAKELRDYSQKEFTRFASTAKWRNDAEMGKDLQSMRRTALTLGFTQEEVASVHDSRMLTILLKASKYDRMMAARPKAVKTGKTSVNPGAGSKGTARRGVISAQKKLARTGSVEDAAGVFGQIIRRN